MPKYEPTDLPDEDYSPLPRFKAPPLHDVVGENVRKIILSLSRHRLISEVESYRMLWAVKRHYAVNHVSNMLCWETDIFGLYFGDDAIYIHCSSTPRKGLIRILEVADARTVARTLQSLRRYGPETCSRRLTTVTSTVYRDIVLSMGNALDAIYDSDDAPE